MSRTLEDYRSVQIDIRVIELALGAINDEEKVHPDKASNFDSLAKQAKWSKTRAEFDRRRAYLRKQLVLKEEMKNSLFESLSQQPISMLSLADLINKVTYIESTFTTGMDRAWDAVSDFLDTLESEESRLKSVAA